MRRKFQPGCPCCEPFIPPTPSPACISGCNGASVPNARVVVTNSDGDTVLDDTTGANGCTDSILWPPGGYVATITPPPGIPGWDATVRSFTMPGGLILPIPLRLSDGYTCGCRAPDRHDYLGVGDPKPNLPETLFFSSENGECALQWFPWKTGSGWLAGVYYGHFLIEDLLSSTANTEPFCTYLTPKTALVDVFFNPCGLRNSQGLPPVTIDSQCLQASSPGPYYDGNLMFGVRYLCGCVICDAQVDGLWQYNLVPDPNRIPLDDPHISSPGTIWNGSYNGFAGWMGPYSTGGTTSQQDPFLWTGNHADAWYGRGLNRCERVDWFPEGTAVVSD